MRVLLLNTTRFGDTLQMQPLIHILKNQGHELAYVCLENFVEVTTMLDGIEHVFPIPGGYSLKYLSESDGKGWYKALNRIEDFAKDIYTHFAPEKIVNLIATPLARLLALRICMQAELEKSKSPSVIKPQVIGFTLLDEGFKDNTNAWASYMEAVTLNRVSSPYNLSDLFTLLSDESLLADGAQNASIAPIDVQYIAEGAKLCKNTVFQNKGHNDFSLKPQHEYLGHSEKHIESIPKGQGFIALQLGASEEKRQWSVENFAALSNMFYEKGYTPVLVGAENEQVLALKFYELGGSAKNLIGKTSIKSLAGVLKSCAMLITNDTGTMHLAAALNTPIVGIFLATAQAWDTGAVSTDACFIEPNLDCHPCNFSTPCPHNFICRSSIPAHIVAQVALKRLSTKEWQQSFSEHARIWKSIRDEYGFLSLEPLDILEKNPRYSLYMMQRIVYKTLINRLQIVLGLKNDTLNQEDIDRLDKEHISKHTQAVEQQNREYFSRPKLDLERLASIAKPNFSSIQLEYILYSDRIALSETLARLLELFFLFAQQGKLMRQMPKMSQAYLLTNERIIMTFKSLPYLVPLAYMWTYGMEKYGDDLDEFDCFTKIIQEIIEAWAHALEANLSMKQ